jgi:VanZ family protein
VDFHGSPCGKTTGNKKFKYSSVRVFIKEIKVNQRHNYFKILFYIGLLAVFILAVIPDTNELPEITKLSDKLNHLAAFFTLAILIDLAYSTKSFLWKFDFLILYGLFIESIQYFLPYREFSLYDLAANIAGLLFYFIVRELKKLNYLPVGRK